MTVWAGFEYSPIGSSTSTKSTYSFSFESDFLGYTSNDLRHSDGQGDKNRFGSAVSPADGVVSVVLFVLVDFLHSVSVVN